MLITQLMDDVAEGSQLIGLNVLGLDSLKRLIDNLKVRLTVKDFLDFVHPAR